jgi:SPP1 gp7 family putative phage head morphogenesis protein
MDPADSWERLGNALLGPYERDILDGLTGAYRALEGRIETAYKRAADGASAMPLQRLLILREQLGQELGALKLPPDLQPVVNQALRAGLKAGDFWALAELRRVAQNAPANAEEALGQLSQAARNAEAILSPGMAQQNPSALVAAAQREAALANYAAGGRGTQAFALLNRLVEVDLRGRIIGSVEFHLASGDSWRQLRSTLQNNLELTKSRAQMVARTEMAAAMVEGTKLRYEAEGIQQVQWQAVGSSRTCGYCAPRHGKVYRLGEVVCPAHPNCRCTVTPWDPEWEELGLVDPQEEAKGRAAVLADLEAAGKEPISGPSPFEKSLGMERAPEALWSPPRVATKSSVATQRKNREPANPEALAAENLKKIVASNFSIAQSTASAGLTSSDIADALQQLMGQPGEAGENAKAMVQFLDKSGTTFVFTGKTTPAERWNIFMQNKTFQEEVLRQRTGEGLDLVGRGIRKKMAGESIDELYESRIDQYLKRFILPSADANGHAYKNYNFVAVKKGELLKNKAFKVEDLAAHTSAVLDQLENKEDVWSFSAMPGGAEKDARSVMSTAIHEIGHVVQFMDETKDDKLGIRLWADKKLTRYSGTNDMEAFAEGFVAFVTQPERLKQMRPKLYDRIRRSLNEYMA